MKYEQICNRRLGENHPVLAHQSDSLVILRQISRWLLHIGLISASSKRYKLILPNVHNQHAVIVTSQIHHPELLNRSKIGSQESSFGSSTQDLHLYIDHGMATAPLFTTEHSQTLSFHSKSNLKDISVVLGRK